MDSIVLYWTSLYWTGNRLYCVSWNCIVLYLSLHCNGQYCIVLDCPVLDCIVMDCIVFRGTVLCCIDLTWRGTERFSLLTKLV